MSDKIDFALQRLAESAATQKFKKLAGPFMCQLEDSPGTWKMATDGLRIIQARVIRAGRELSRTPPLEGEIKKIYSKYLSLPASAIAYTNIKVASLIAFCGESKWSEKCPACLGTSAKNKHVSCSFCEGDGVIAPDKKCGYVCDLPVNLALLAPPVELFADATEVDLSIEKSKLTLWLVSDFLRVIFQGEEGREAEWEKAKKWCECGEEVKPDAIV